MAEAMIKGLLSASFIEGKNLMVADVCPVRQEWLRQEYRAKTSADSKEVAKKCEIIILAVKPQAMKDVLENIADEVDHKKLIISIAAGIPIKTIEGSLSPDGKKKTGRGAHHAQYHRHWCWKGSPHSRSMIKCPQAISKWRTGFLKRLEKPST